jgi:RNA polymerase sigma factor (sigma-70 family)
VTEPRQGPDEEINAAVTFCEQDLRLSVDKTLRAKIRDAGPDSDLAHRFEEKLLELGMGTLSNMYRNNCLKWTIRGEKFSADSKSMPESVEDRRTLFYFAVREAVTRFLRECIFGNRWDPSRGASLNTFFINKCLMCFHSEHRRYRKVRAKQVVEELVADVNEAVPAQRLVQQSNVFEHPEVVLDRSVIDNILGQLKVSERDRTIFVRHVGQGWSQREIAVELGISESTVNGAIRRIKSKLAVLKGGV